jgi:signal recognition particle GTPase
MNPDVIKDALLKLDVNDDDKWTMDGLPKVDALGIADIKRKDITNVAPFFTRTNPEISSDEDGATDEDNQEEATVEEVEFTESDVVGNDDLDTRQIKAKKVLEEKLAVLNQAKKEYELAEKILDDIEIQIAKTGRGQSTQQDIIDHIRNQHDQRMKRAERMQAVIQAGIVPNYASKSPIDQAMANKNTRGTQRPVRGANVGK